MTEVTPTYDVALSFAGEDRAYVQEVADGLRRSAIRVFYDEYEQVALWGKDLYSHLDWVYRKASRFCVLFISDHYARKVWTSYERRSIQARAFEENSEYMLPARFDDTEVEGVLSTVGVVDLRVTNPAEFVRLICAKVGPTNVRRGFPSNPDRLWSLLEVAPDDASERGRVQEVAYDFFRALERMTEDERTAVAGAFAFSCLAELPEAVHISLDFLHRMTQLPNVQLLNELAAVRSLNVKVRTRAHTHDADELQADDTDLVVSFWTPSADGADDATQIAAAAIRCASDHYCEEHGLEVLRCLDFSRLSTELQG